MWWHTRRNQSSSFGENGRVHLNQWGCQFSRLLAAEVSASAVVTLDKPFRGNAKGTGYPLQSPVSSSLTRPCVTVCHHISTGVYISVFQKTAVTSSTASSSPTKISRGLLGPCIVQRSTVAYSYEDMGGKDFLLLLLLLFFYIYVDDTGFVTTLTVTQNYTASRDFVIF